jgi:hypothetical protein
MPQSALDIYENHHNSSQPSLITNKSVVKGLMGSAEHSPDAAKRVLVRLIVMFVCRITLTARQLFARACKDPRGDC